MGASRGAAFEAHRVDRMRELVGAMFDYREAHRGLMPSVRDLMPPMGLTSESGVALWLANAEREGLVVNVAERRGASRAWVLTEYGEEQARRVRGLPREVA